MNTTSALMGYPGIANHSAQMHIKHNMQSAEQYFNANVNSMSSQYNAQHPQKTFVGRASQAHSSLDGHAGNAQHRLGMTTHTPDLEAENSKYTCTDIAAGPDSPGSEHSLSERPRNEKYHAIDREAEE